MYNVNIIYDTILKYNMIYDLCVVLYNVGGIVHYK